MDVSAATNYKSAMERALPWPVDAKTIECCMDSACMNRSEAEAVARCVFAEAVDVLL